MNADPEAFADGQPKHLWPRNLAELVDVLADDLRRHGTSDNGASLARRLVAAIALHHGGRPFYLPRGDTLRKALLQDAIYRAANGKNHHELARQHNLSLRAIQRIVANQTKLHRARAPHAASQIHDQKPSEEV